MKRILAIDDDENNLILIKTILSKNIEDGIVQTAMSGIEGIAKAKELKPDVILLDILMPGMNGFEVCQALKNDDFTKDIPILLVSALGQNYQNRIKGLNLGAEAFITKPFESPELISHVKVLLRIKDAEDMLRKKNEDLEKSLEEIKNDQEKLRKLNSELLMAEEKERRRIAEYLHDGIGPILSLANINLSSLLRKELVPDVQGTIHKATKLLSDAIAQSRSLTYDLSPPVLYELGLIPAIKWKLSQVELNHKINTGFQSSLPKLDLSIDTGILVYRIISELLTNVIKHASANKIDIQIKKDERFYYFLVSDNGKGFDFKGKTTLLSNNSYGLFSIKERLDSIKGDFIIETELNKGTKTTISIPVKNI
ncbi:MAG: response regulator [Bacteroidales bacterium]|nr:response regulator [Bacteroidales bacterium]